MARKKNKTKPKNASQNIPVQHIPEFPKLGHQLIISHPKPIKGFSKSEGWIRVAPTWGQRFRRFITTFLEAFGFALFAVAILYLPDFIADYSHRSDHFIRFFFIFLLSSVLIIGFCAAILTFIRDSVCYIHPQNRRIFFGTRFNQAKIEESLEIRDLTVLTLIPPSSILRRTQILTTQYQMEIKIAETFGDDEDINALHNWLKACL